MNKTKFIVILLTVFQILFNLNAQKPTYLLNTDIEFSQYKIEQWTTENGLPSNYLLRICQTSDGYIWLSSYSGLIRFDGINFKIFDKHNSKLFLNNSVADLVESNDSTLWIATQKSGILSYKNGKFKSHGLNDNLYKINDALFIDNENRIWASSPQKGWFCIKNDTVEYVKYHKPLKDIEVDDINQDIDGNIWFGTYKYGLFKYQNKKLTAYTTDDGLASNNVFKVFNNYDGSIIIGTAKGISYMKDDTFVTDSVVKGFAVYQIRNDFLNNIWAFTSKGIYRKDANTNSFKVISNNSNFSNNYILDAIFDFEGNLWVLNYKGGLSKIKNGKFTNYTQKFGLSGKSVNAICEYEKGVYLMGLDNGSINKIVGNKISIFETKTQLKGKRIRHILKDSKDNIWISTYSGLLKINKNGKEIMIDEKINFPSHLIRIAYEDKKNNIWVGTRDVGIIKISENEEIEIFDKSKGLEGNLILSINGDNEGNVYVGSSGGGLGIISPNGNIKNLSEKNGFVSNIVFSSYIDNDGIAWIATNNGLSVIKDGKITNLKKQSGLKSESLFDIVEDNIGNLWITSSIGILKIKRQELLDYIDKKIKIVDCSLYNKQDGMVETECNSTAKILKSQNGELWFPLLSGVSKINPETIPINNYVPPVYIQELTIDGKETNLSDTIIIEPSKKRLSFNFTGLSFHESTKVLFKYKLEGFEDEWVDLGSKRTISFTNLPYGKYTFRVIAGNNDGVWNTKGASLSFYIKPYFYKTIWFYLIMILAILIAIFSIYRIRIIRLEKRQNELENIVTERTAEINKKKEEIQAQADNLIDINNLLVETKKEIEFQHTQIKDSINYASKIQEALLSSIEPINAFFSEHFIYFRPRDIVSGDFYWTQKVDNHLLFAVADCTGHGVPGAFMSLLSISFLNEIVVKRKIIQTNLVLEELRELIKISLKQSSDYNGSKDGLDIALCSVNTKTNELQYSGAHNSLYIVRSKSIVDKTDSIAKIMEKDKYKLLEIKASMQPIGVFPKEKPFIKHKIKLYENDKLYLFSDGYIDQFGKVTFKKFMTKTFKNLLLDINNKKMSEQSNILDKTLIEWKKDLKQIDDIIVMGMKI